MTYFEAHCTLCNKDWTIQLPYDDSVFRMKWDLWAQGRLIQEVFPELNSEKREGLSSGICSACWEKYIVRKT